MTGRIVHEPEPVTLQGHHCSPPHSPDPSARPNPAPGKPYSSWPKGTVWQCDCARTWVTTRNGDWQPEGWLARRRRLRHGHIESTSLTTGETTTQPLPRPMSPEEFVDRGSA